MKRFWLFLGLVLSAGFLQATPEEDILPFGVKVGGQVAKVEKASEVFAKLKEPVGANAELEIVVEGAVPMLIINAFPCDAAGTVKPEAAPAIFFVENSKKVKLDATMDKKKLEPGFYALNIVAVEKTARVLLQIK
jgi:hypothetical protein